MYCMICELRYNCFVSHQAEGKISQCKKHTNTHPREHHKHMCECVTCPVIVTDLCMPVCTRTTGRGTGKTS